MGEIVRPESFFGRQQLNYGVDYRAPETWLAELARATPAEVKINAGGEMLPWGYAPKLPTDWDFKSPLAQGVQAGMVWADWGGYPMCYIENPYSLQMWRPGQAGFRTFLKVADKLFSHDFWSDKDLFTYPRSLRILQTRPPFIIPNPYSPQAGRCSSSFALKMGQGCYFYAYAHKSAAGVNPSAYGRFISETLAGAITPPNGDGPPVVPGPNGSSVWWWLLAGAGALGLAAYLWRRERGEGRGV